MKYFQIDWAYDSLDTIGHYPQIEISDDNNFKDYNNARNVKPDVFPDFTPKLNLKFHKKAKITNYIERSSVSFGMFIDSQFKTILEKFNLPNHRFYEINVKQDNKIYVYYWFHYLINDFWDLIDKKNSKAVIIDNKKNFQPVDEIDLNMNEEQMKNFFYFEIPYYQNPKWEKIVFKKEFPNYDIYKTKIDFKTIISERLLDDLKSNGMNGFEAKPYDIIQFEK